MEALYRTLAPTAKTPAARSWRFNVRSLFILIFIASLTLGAARPFLHVFGSSLQNYIAFIFCVLTLFGIGVALWLSLRQHSLEAMPFHPTKEPICTIENPSTTNPAANPHQPVSQ
ncbi:MAG: hypothetical protein ACR2FY_08985 [Pirellulaceae bacterium]